MDVNMVHGTSTAYPATNASLENTVKATNDKNTEANEKAADENVVYQRSQEGNGISRADVNARIKEGTQNVEAFKRMVQKLLESQGKKALNANRLSKEEDPMISIDPETRAAAQEAISEDGYFGVRQTSERILSFAKALAGEDASKFEMLKDAIIEGFKQAREVWGGELPDICNKTYDAVMSGLDSLEKELRGEPQEIAV